MAADLEAAAFKRFQQGVRSGEVDQNWLFCIPIQIGPPTPYAKSLQKWHMLIILLQIAVLVGQIVLRQAIVTALWIGVTVAAGLYAWRHDMNITLMCVWGLFCAFQGVMTLLGDLIPTILNLKLDIVKLIVVVGTPAVYALAAAFAWHLYNDYAEDHGRTASSFDPFNKVAGKIDIEKIPINERKFDRTFGAVDKGSGWGLFGGGGQAKADPYATRFFDDDQQQDGFFPSQQKQRFPNCC
eukprot:TRINITY_DN61918_c0_g1_i1.p1 TRINITY_DN61918_c0_g1~~TRINITY_DN61918_c0_g1_i1.p1  ORF type:complete len:265 (+),score=39.18 TRINITY_DN61918_c0_g1_i1:78-797(+)